MSTNTIPDSKDFTEQQVNDALWFLKRLLLFSPAWYDPDNNDEVAGAYFVEFVCSLTQDMDMKEWVHKL